MKLEIPKRLSARTQRQASFNGRSQSRDQVVQKKSSCQVLANTTWRFTNSKPNKPLASSCQKLRGLELQWRITAWRRLAQLLEVSRAATTLPWPRWPTALAPDQRRRSTEAQTSTSLRMRTTVTCQVQVPTTTRTRWRASRLAKSLSAYSSLDRLLTGSLLWQRRSRAWSGQDLTRWQIWLTTTRNQATRFSPDSRPLSRGSKTRPKSIWRQVQGSMHLKPQLYKRPRKLKTLKAASSEQHQSGLCHRQKMLHLVQAHTSKRSCQNQVGTWRRAKAETADPRRHLAPTYTKVRTQPLVLNPTSNRSSRQWLPPARTTWTRSNTMPNHTPSLKTQGSTASWLTQSLQHLKPKEEFKVKSDLVRSHLDKTKIKSKSQKTIWDQATMKPKAASMLNTQLQFFPIQI